MKNIIFMAFGSFLHFSMLNLFVENNSLSSQAQQGKVPEGQPRLGQLQVGSSVSQGVEEYALPSGRIAEDEIPRIKTAMQEVLKKISEARKSVGKRSDNPAIKSGMLDFQAWLRKQGCISQASSAYDLEASDKYAENIFITYPGQLPFDIVFRMGEDTKQYRLLLFVSPVEFLRFGSLVENRLEKIPVPQNWPKNYMPYFKNRGES